MILKMTQNFETGWFLQLLREDDVYVVHKGEIEGSVIYESESLDSREEADHKFNFEQERL